MTFKELYVGQRFVFDREPIGLAMAGVATGPWIKLSPRKYRQSETADGPRTLARFQVGTIHVKVRPVA